MDALGVSQGLLERVTGHMRAGLVGWLDDCQACINRCHSSCSGCIDTHCDQAESTLAKCWQKIDQFLVNKLGYCYGILARFGVTFPAIHELEEGPRPAPQPPTYPGQTPEQPGQPEPAGERPGQPESPSPQPGQPPPIAGATGQMTRFPLPAMIPTEQGQGPGGGPPVVPGAQLGKKLEPVMKQDQKPADEGLRDDMVPDPEEEDFPEEFWKLYCCYCSCSPNPCTPEWFYRAVLNWWATREPIWPYLQNQCSFYSVGPVPPLADVPWPIEEAIP